MSPLYVNALVPDRFVEVDAARLLLILARFSLPIPDDVVQAVYFPQHQCARHFSPEYYLQKLDFLLRYPGYFAYEMVELHRMGIAEASDGEEVMRLVRMVLGEREPELLTLPFRKFWRGAYERIDQVEAWWHARGLVYARLEERGQARPQKHYFVTEEGLRTAERLVDLVGHARWYAERIALIAQFFGGLTPAEVKHLQYEHLEYRQAQLDETIPDLPLDEIRDRFQRVFGEPVEQMLVGS